MAETKSEDTNTIIGYFPSEAKAEVALQALLSSNFRREQIGLAGQAEPANASKPGKSGFWQRTRDLFTPTAPNSEVPETDHAPITGAGVAAGSDSEETSRLHLYDVQDFHETLQGLSLPEERSRYFSEKLSRDREGVLMTVNAGSRKSDAELILRNMGADLGEEVPEMQRTETAPEPAETTAEPAETAPATAPEIASVPHAETAPAPEAELAPEPRTESSVPAPENQRIQLYGEMLRVHRERINRGEVRLRKETVTETQSINVPVTHEELVLERTPVDEEKPAPGAEIGEKQEVRIPLAEEHVSVEKTPVVREEVRAGKREVTEMESHEEPVRREELKIEDQEQTKNEEKRRAA